MLVNRNNHEVMSGLTRSQINAIAGGKTPEAQEHHQARILAPLKEVGVLKHHKHDGFKLEDRARLVNK